MKRTLTQMALAREVRRARLPHHRDLDLARVLHRLLDLLADVAGQAHGAEVVDRLPA